MDGDRKFIIGIILATVAIVVVAVFFLTKDQKGLSNEGLVDRKIVESEKMWTSGANDPKVVIVEFSDFQCPACKAVEPIIKRVMEKYKDTVRFGYRHFPLSIHPNAFDAALAAEAAGKQNKFWEMHDLLFEKQSDLSKDKLQSYAKGLDLNMEQFDKDFNSDELRQKILNDQADANKAGLEATPTFFINGVKFTGIMTTEQLEREIKRVSE